MAIPVSTVPAVKAAIVAGATAQVNDTAVLVSYDTVGVNLPDDIIVAGGVDRTVQVLAQVGDAGPGHYWEKYTLEFTISTYRGGDDAQLVEERAYTLLAAMETFVRTDPTVGGLVLEAQPTVSRADTVWNEEHAGYVTTIVAPISVSAVI